MKTSPSQKVTKLNQTKFTFAEGNQTTPTDFTKPDFAQRNFAFSRDKMSKLSSCRRFLNQTYKGFQTKPILIAGSNKNKFVILSERKQLHFSLEVLLHFLLRSCVELYNLHRVNRYTAAYSSLTDRPADSGLSACLYSALTDSLSEQAMAGDNSPAFINKTIRNALNMANITPGELAKASTVHSWRHLCSCCTDKK